MNILKRIGIWMQRVGGLGVLFFVWRYVDWQYVKDAPTAMGNLEILGPVLGILASGAVFLTGLLLMVAATLWLRFRPPAALETGHGVLGK